MPTENARKHDDRRELLAAAIAPRTTNQEQRTVDVLFYSGCDVDRIDYWSGDRYVLRFDPAGADLSLLNNAAPVLDGHNRFEGAAGQNGVVVKAWKDADGWKATLRFSKRPDVDGLWGDIADGIVCKFSMGVELLEVTEERDKNNKLTTRTATSWRPYEISTEPIPADWGTQTLNRAEARQEGDGMPNTTTAGNPAQEKLTRDAALDEVCATFLKRGDIDGDFVAQLKAEGKSVEQAKSALIDHLAAKSEANPISGSHAINAAPGGKEKLAARMAEALACRYTGKEPSDPAREFMGARIADLARVCCERNGLRPSMDAASTIELAHTTSDFPNLLQGTGERMLLESYRAAQANIKRIARPSTASDFRTKSMLRLGEAPKLLQVNEGGEIKQGSRAEAAESYKLLTYARIFSITRNALINDDLSAFADFSRAWGIAAANLEGNVLVNLLYGAAGVGPTMSDTKALFSADHGNLLSPGAAISDTSLSAARLALRTMKGLDKDTLIEVAPRYLVVPAALETTAEKYLATIYPAQASDANPFGGGKLELIVEPRLDAKSATGWYVVGDPALCPVLEYSYLNGAPGPQVATRQGWEVLGMEFRCVLDFGAGALDHRGAYKGNA
jgi:hypothetical protein